VDKSKHKLTSTSDSGKHKIDFSLREVPAVSQFVQRDVEMCKLERLLLDNPATTRRQKVVLLYGLGGIGKTQLAVEFAREHHGRFSSVVWLDGSSEASLKQSFAAMVPRLPRSELTADGVEMLKHFDVDVGVRECLRWLSLPTNRHWLLIFDNVDRDFGNAEDPQAYNVEAYLPSTDHGSVLITSRLARLQRHGPGVKVGTVNAEQARAILENNAGRTIEGKLNIAYLSKSAAKLTVLLQAPTPYLIDSMDFLWPLPRPARTCKRLTCLHRPT
jgi:hypothetical protein